MIPLPIELAKPRTPPYRIPQSVEAVLPRWTLDPVVLDAPKIGIQFMVRAPHVECAKSACVLLANVEGKQSEYSPMSREQFSEKRVCGRLNNWNNWDGWNDWNVVDVFELWKNWVGNLIK
jgi:hypothetical protein